MMVKTRPDGSPLTRDDPEFWNRPYVYQEFPKMLYRRRRSEIARSSTTAMVQPEGTTTTPAGIVLEYVTVQCGADEAMAGTEGWADLPTATSE
jgi:hypothetical protein